MPEFPSVSCFCATYGRTKLLMESVNCFLNQDYKGKKELIILNDFDQQELFFDHPEIKVINSKKIKKLSDKFNECISYCSGDYIFVWALCMHKDCWKEIGFYSDSDGTDIDTLLFDKIKNNYGIIHQKINNENIYNIYRYETTNHYHGSQIARNFLEKVPLYLQEKIKNKEEPTEIVVIKPYWKYDYVETANLFLKNSM